MSKQTKRTRKQYELNPNICPTCNTVIPWDKRYNKFCNKSCSATFNNRGVDRHEKRPKECAHCGEIKETCANKYCDACIAEGVYNKPQTLAEIKTDRARRHFLIRKRGHRCAICKLTKWNRIPITLELDHIDGNPDNNCENNLRLLCPNCHSQTEFYKGRGVNSRQGRHSLRRSKRRKRYKEGKSY